MHDAAPGFNKLSGMVSRTFGTTQFKATDVERPDTIYLVVVVYRRLLIQSLSLEAIDGKTFRA